ncbi:hypothetical protein [Leisingera caerulea]|uniref:hypothetical protein n=1 Tax=Leisingera caerulea TaxID=506591 RepID=UPI0021A837FF|nr:hypothetical protein [Leisingera caerulea]UWQ84145.1 hypothetical protein K3726_02785 [Leisingera caerulea]
MLTDIYARSMLTATRQDCVKLREFPAAKTLPRAYEAPPRGKGLLNRLVLWLRRRPTKTRCIHPRNI